MLKFVDIFFTNCYTKQAKTSESFGGLAQLGERLICIQEVNGSIPLFSTKRPLWMSGQIFGVIAQLVRAHAW